MSSYGFDAPQQLRKKHLDEYRGFESMTSDQLFAALDDPACSPDRCILIATELVARGADTSGVVPLLRWILRGFDGNQTRYRAAIALARMGEWDAEIQTALQHITERYPRMHGDAKAALDLLQNHGRLVNVPAEGPAMNLPKAPAPLLREMPPRTIPRVERPPVVTPALPTEQLNDEMLTPTGEALPALDISRMPGELPASRIKVRKSRKTLAYPSARNTAIIALFVIAVGLVVAIVLSQGSTHDTGLQVMVEED